MAKEFDSYCNSSMIQNMKQRLAEKFASENHAGPVDVAEFMDLLSEDEADIIKRDAYEQIQALLGFMK